MLRDPVPPDFTRFYLYSTRIRKIGSFSDRYPIAWAGSREVSEDAWGVLLHHAPKPLLPNLRSLQHEEKPYKSEELALPGRGFFRPADAFFGPSLRSVLLNGLWEYPTRPDEVIKKMSRTSLLIESLWMEAKMSPPPEFASLSCPELGVFIHLTHFEGWTMNVGPDALLALGSLPRLQDMLLHVEPADFTWDALQHGRHACFFPALTKLTLHNIAFEWCTAFLHTLTSAFLQKLLLRVRNPPRAVCVPDSMLFEALCAAIGSLPCGTSLHEIEIRFPRIPDVARSTYQPRHIAPLAGLKGALRRLSIFVPRQIIVDDVTLDAMARAWPHIQALFLPWREHLQTDGVADDEERWPRLCPNPEDDHFPQATLAGLAALVRRCTRLTTLMLALDMRVVPELETPPASLHLPWGCGLQCLTLAGSVLCDPVAVSAFFAMACPQIKNIGNGCRDEMDWYYSRFLRIRGQERKWLLRRGEPGSEVMVSSGSDT